MPSLRRLSCAAAAALLLLVPACSSSDDSSSDTTAPTTATAAASATTSTPADATPEGTTLARYADYKSENYDDSAHWLCRPDQTDVCDQDLDTTVVSSDGSMKVERFEADPDAPIDCFYVYPTISQDETTYSDWNASPDEEEFVTLQQAARLGSVCRVFAPVYRQRTLTGLVAALTGTDAKLVGPKADPLADVLDAFRTYMAKDNGGRGFVLVGHSQGADLLSQLIKKEVDPNDDVRRLLVGAYLAGWWVAVPEGKLIGGDYEHVPVCADPSTAGCVTTWASFAEDAPPPANTIFGVVREGEGVAACVNPASVGENKSTESVALHGYFPSERGRSILAPPKEALPRTWLADGTGEVDTPFVSLPGLVTGRCTTNSRGAHYLEVTETVGREERRVTDLGGRLTPEWGLHLLDMNLVMGDIIDRVKDQTKDWLN
ncbi:MAG: DUF3089 domain-containing protein [Acidimicrobiales bacterium]|nr:DUF3089 domain-containing protein [Acidimicrobiales bacterium]